MPISTFNKKVGVLMGGISREREISLRSGKHVLDILLKQNIDAIPVIINDNVIPKELFNIDIAFLALHGTKGEDGVIQGLLDFLEIPYTGSGVKTSSICMDKLLTKELFCYLNIPTAAYIPILETTTAKDIESKIAIPFVLKAREEGSSFGIQIIKNEKQLNNKLAPFIKEFPKSFVEKYLPGKELTFGILVEKDKTTFFPSLEMIPNNEFYDFEAKYTKGMTSFECPAKISKTMEESIINDIKKILSFLDIKGIARFDLILDNKENYYFTEINTCPGLTETSDIPIMSEKISMPIENLINRILEAV